MGSGLATEAAFRSCYCRLERAKCAAIFESNAGAGASGSQAFLGGHAVDVVARGGECLSAIADD